MPLPAQLRSVGDRVRKRIAINRFLRFAPAGHFYSPLPAMVDVEARRDRIFDQGVTEVPGINLRVGDQLALLEAMSAYMEGMPFTDAPTPGLRYYFQNQYFTYGDALVLYALLRHLGTRCIVEVGSGFSSAVTLDTADRFCSDLRCTFIEPYQQERLHQLLKGTDRASHAILEQPVQDVDLTVFEALEANDILLIDSSHIAKVGSDVEHLFTRVLPALKPGVWVHFHDIFWPFEYPEVWVREGRAWNEAYMLKAFLQFNETFVIRFFISYLAVHHRQAVQRALPLAMANPGSGLWLQRVQSSPAS